MLKEKRNEESLDKFGKKYIYKQVREVEMDVEDILNIKTREKMNIDEAKQGLVTLKQKIRRSNDFLSKNKKLFEEAMKLSDTQFCEMCGMDFNLPVNKGMRSPKTKAPYKVICKNCAKKSGL